MVQERAAKCRGSAFNRASSRRVVVCEASGTQGCSRDWGSFSGGGVESTFGSWDSKDADIVWSCVHGGQFREVSSQNGRSKREEAQCGLQASRVGEACHPGPPTAHSQHSVPEEVLDALQFDLSRDDSDSNVLNSQEGSHEVAHFWVSEDRSRRTRRRVKRVQNDSDSDVALMWVSRIDEPRNHVGQRRVVLVPQDSPTQVSSAVVPTLPASSGAVRRLLLVNSAQQVPSAQVISGPASVSPEVPEVAVADEARDAVSDTVSVEHESDLRSVVPSEASIEFADDPGIRAAITRGFSVGLVQLDGFHVAEIFERRAQMRVVPCFMRAAFSSAMKAACEGIPSGFSAGDLILQERAWTFSFGCCCVDPVEEEMSPRRNLSKGWQCSIRGIGRSWFCTASPV